MSTQSELSGLDSSILDLEIRDQSQRADTGLATEASLSGHAVALVAAMHAAARSAHLVSRRDVTDVSSRQREIDGAATDAAEEVFDRAEVPIAVAAGEGPGDRMPGAFAGQHLGGSPVDGERWDGVFDYVDGTTLAANRIPGALSLGALGRGVSSVPDLQAFAVLIPTEMCSTLDILSRPEDSVVAILELIAAQQEEGKTLKDLRVLTHSEDTGPFHRELIRTMRAAGVGEVIVPDPVIIEPPYILSLAGVGTAAIDTMVGVFGFPELAFAALLLDLVAPRYGFAFRPASLAGGEERPSSEVLDPFFNFSREEEEALADRGWATDRQYSGVDLVAPNAGEAACIFAVTDNPVLGLGAPTVTGECLTVSGLLALRGGRVLRLDVTSQV